MNIKVKCYEPFSHENRCKTDPGGGRTGRQRNTQYVENEGICPRQTLGGYYITPDIVFGRKSHLQVWLYLFIAKIRWRINTFHQQNPCSTMVARGTKGAEGWRDESKQAWGELHCRGVRDVACANPPCCDAITLPVSS